MYERPFIGERPDYSKKELWLSLPEKNEYPVDIFYLYPSACMDPEAPLICPIDHVGKIQGAKDYFIQ